MVTSARQNEPLDPLGRSHQLKGSYCAGLCSECWLYRSGTARRLRPHLIFSTAACRGDGGQGHVPHVRLESRLKCCEKLLSAAAMREIITRTWPSLYDSNNTFSRDQSFFINPNVTNSAQPEPGRGPRCMEYLWCLCVLKATVTKAVKQTYKTVWGFLLQLLSAARHLFISLPVKAASLQENLQKLWLQKTPRIRNEIRELCEVVFCPNGIYNVTKAAQYFAFQDF